MADMLIRDVPDDIVDRLKSEALHHGRSVEAEALEAILRGVVQQSRFTVEEARARVARSLARYAGPQPSIALDDIREGLEGAI